MGCCASDLGVPDEILGDPDNNLSNFYSVKRAGLFSSHYNVFNQEGQKWLMIRDESKMMEPHATLTLENFVRGDDDHGETLATLKVETLDLDFKAKVEEDDDEDEDFFELLHDLFSDDGSDDEQELECKSKWKCKRVGKIRANGLEMKVSVRIKGKTNLAYSLEDESLLPDPTEVKHKPKKVDYKIEANGDTIKLEYENGKWSEEKKREWKAPGLFTVTSRDPNECEVTTEAGASVPSAPSLLLAFAIVAFFNPKRYEDMLISKAKDFGKEEMEKRRG